MTEGGTPSPPTRRLSVGTYAQEHVMAPFESAWLDDGLALFFGGTPTEAEAAEWDFRASEAELDAAAQRPLPQLRLIHQGVGEARAADTRARWLASEQRSPRAACA